MPVAQHLIDLLHLPIPALRRLATATGVPSSRTDTKLELAQRIAEHVPELVLDEWAHDPLFAGQSSVTWLTLGSAEALHPEAVRAALTAVGDGIDPLEVPHVRPAEVDARPRQSRVPCARLSAVLLALGLVG